MARFAFEKPEQLIDFAYRSHHETAVKAKSARAGVLRQGGRAGVLHRLLLGRLRRPDGGAALSRRLRRHRRRRAGEQLDAADGGGLRRRARGPEGSRQPPAAPGTRPAASRGARRLRRRRRRRRRRPRRSAAVHVRSGHAGVRRRSVAADLPHASRRSKPRAACTAASRIRGPGRSSIPGLAPGSEPFWPHRDPRQSVPDSDSRTTNGSSSPIRTGTGRSFDFNDADGLRRRTSRPKRSSPRSSTPPTRTSRRSGSAAASCCSITAGTTS